ncbi:Na(+)/H(+) antiporter subunit B [Mycoplasmatota bacterium WC44]
MKKLLSLALVLVLGYGIISHLDGNDSFTKYGEAEVENRVSDRYLDKNVTEDNSSADFGDEELETGSANFVTSIVANYRSFDTLGEVTVLFISAFGVALLLATTNQRRLELNFKPNFMLKVGSRALFGIIIMTGLYVAIHGHLTPGGGFPGGAMIASSILLLYLSDDSFRTKIKGFKLLESVMGSLYVLIGIAGLFLAGGYFLQNFLGTGVVGELFSAGLIPIIYVIIGLKVGSEIASIIDNFLSEEVQR